MTEPRDPHVRQVVFELLEGAPAAPPFSEVDAAMTDDVAPRRAHTRRRRTAAALLAVVIIAAAVTAVVLMRREPARRGGVVGPRTTVAPGPAASPDVAYVDSRGLVVRAAGSGREVVVDSGPASTPRWSPSGRWLAYRKGDELWAVGADGSYREQLTGHAAPNYLSDAYSWSPTLDALAVLDGPDVRVFWFTAVSAAAAGELQIAPPVGGVEAAAQSLAWSRGGTSLAISMVRRTHAGPGAPESSLWMAIGVCAPGDPLSCSRPRQLQRLPYRPGPTDYPIFLAGFGFDNTHVMIWPDYIGSGSVALDGLPLKAVPIDGGTDVTIGSTLVRSSWVVSSPDGSRLLFVRSTGRMVTDNREVDVCDAPTQCHPVAPGHDVQTLDPSWSPDGKQIAFVREEPASFAPVVVAGNIDWTVKYRTRKLWVASADGSGAHEITAAGGGVADPQFSPDGHAIVFVRDASVRQLDLASNRVVALTGSMRLRASCAPGECLPDAAVYETEASWSDHAAVRFPPAAGTPATTPSG